MNVKIKGKSLIKKNKPKNQTRRNTKEQTAGKSRIKYRKRYLILIIASYQTKR